MGESAPLLAKSPRANRPPLTLSTHLRDTEDAACWVFRLDRRWGTAFSRFFGLEGEARNRFLVNLRVAALFHDIGKANEEFQSAVTGSRLVQTLRHEHISALVLHLPQVRSWLETSSVLDVSVITAAVLSHHLKASEDAPWPWGQWRGADSLRLRLNEAEIEETMARVAEVIGLDKPAINWPRSWRHAGVWATALDEGRREAKRLRRILRRQRPADSERRAMLLAVKAGLIVADSVASGLVREGHPIEKWIDDVAHRDALRPEDVDQHVIQARLDQVSRARQITAGLQPFQTLVATRGPRVLLLAACGAGKTLAAWSWARQQLRERPAGRVIFLYPTRGTATEGFRDYVGWAPEADAALVHGTSAYELEEMRRNPAESTAGKDYTDEASQRLFALGLWSKRYFSATVDQFLGFMEHRYESLCLLPALADSVVIFDEVHSYDARLFANLCEFLATFDVPALCMTATLPPSRRAELEQRAMAVFPAPDDREALAELTEKEAHPRYRVEWQQDPDAPVRRAAQAVGRGLRVLVVVNTVARCQSFAVRLGAQLQQPVLCYHSRYRLVDRKHAHEQTVAAFQQRDHAVAAVTTQVCEMSLDLDADVLITELAPTTSLVQRFGRTNRHLARGMDFQAEIVVVPAPDELPYDSEELEKARAFVDAIEGDAISQSQLAEIMLNHCADAPSLEGAARFVHSGYYATPGSLRDGSDFLTTCVLDGDLDEASMRLRRKEGIDPLLVPVPRRSVLAAEDRPAFLPRFLGVASSKDYDSHLGFMSGDGTR